MYQQTYSVRHTLQQGRIPGLRRSKFTRQMYTHTHTHTHNFLSILVDACGAEFTLVFMQELKKMRAACRLGAEVREFAGTLVKVRQVVVQFLSASTAVSATKGD